MKDEVFEAQKNIMRISKEERGFLRHGPSKEFLKHDLEWVD